MGQLRGRVAAFMALAVVAVSIGGLMGRVSGPGVPGPSTTVHVSTEPPSPDTVRVHVSGMVVAPGVVDVPSDAIVADAIDAAGGLLPEAVVDHINLAAPVSAGGQIVVPGPEDQSPSNPGAGDGLLSLNRATPGELESLPGVGPVLAERIVSFREESGGFETVEDLLEVPGIGEAKLGAIRDLVQP